MPAFERIRAWAITARDALSPPRPVDAHCDIPCGIYDPHEAQIAALTVIRMDQLIAELPKPTAGAKPEEMETYGAKLARYMVVKEQHSERVKQEIRVLLLDELVARELRSVRSISSGLLVGDGFASSPMSWSIRTIVRAAIWASCGS